MAIISSHRNNNFNLFRLVFAVLVIFSHSPQLVDGDRSRELLIRATHNVSLGELAVDGFFLLSGYLIVRSWLHTPAVVDFLRNRILRIFPAFILATAVCAFVVGPIAAATSGYFSDLSMFALFTGALFLQQPVIPPVFDGSYFPFVNNSVWTLSFEFICYVGALVAGVCGITKRRKIWLAVTVAALTALFMHRWGLWSPPAVAAFLSHPLARFGSFFLVGGCYYLFNDRIVFKGGIAIVAGVVLMVGLCSWRFNQLALLTAGSYLLFYMAFQPIASIADFNRLPDISYGVYLYGWPVQKLLLWYFPTLSPWLLFFLALIGALACGLASWNLVEKPFLQLKRGFRHASTSSARPV